MDFLFQSPRLGFRQWQSTDITPFAALNADADVMEFFPATLSHDETRKAVQRYQKHFETYGYGWYAADLLETGDFVGFIGFGKVDMEVSFNSSVEIGWRLSKTYWGKGLATEGAKACLEYGWTTLGFSEVYSLTATLNKRSARVMEKLGMSYQGNFLHPKLEKGHPLEEHVLYRIHSPKN